MPLTQTILSTLIKFVFVVMQNNKLCCKGIAALFCNLVKLSQKFY